MLNRNGYVFITSLLVMSLLLVAAVSVTTVSFSALTGGNRSTQNASALSIAEAGVEDVMQQLNRTTSPLSCSAAGTANGQVFSSAEQGKGEYSVAYTPEPSPPAGKNGCLITSTGRLYFPSDRAIPAATKRIKVVVRGSLPISETTQCADNIDNDGDGKVDFDGPGTVDPGCSSLTDDIEQDAVAPPFNYAIGKVLLSNRTGGGAAAHMVVDAGANNATLSAPQALAEVEGSSSGSYMRLLGSGLRMNMRMRSMATDGTTGTRHPCSITGTMSIFDSTEVITNNYICLPGIPPLPVGWSERQASSLGSETAPQSQNNANSHTCSNITSSGVIASNSGSVPATYSTGCALSNVTLTLEDQVQSNFYGTAFKGDLTHTNVTTSSIRVKPASDWRLGDKAISIF